MKVYNGIAEKINITKPVITVGTFDGVHAGHRKIIKTLSASAKKTNGETVLLTFYPHPRLVLFPEDNQLQLLSTLEEKKLLLQEAGIQHLIVLPFTKKFSRLTAEQYVKKVLVDSIGVHKLVIGYDHHFGRNREGDINELKMLATRFNFELEEIPAKDINHIKVSSTKVRRALADGDVKTARKYLTYPFFINGVVEHGEKIGRKIGFPTANIKIKDALKLIPANGIYAVKVSVNNKTYHGMLNIGTRPTIGDGKFAIEVNIFNFNNNIYGKPIRICFIERIRDEVKFDNLTAMQKQIEKDEISARRILQ